MAISLQVAPPPQALPTAQPRSCVSGARRCLWHGAVAKGMLRALRACCVASRACSRRRQRRLTKVLPCGQAEDKEALLRKQAREARYKAAELSDKARRLRALAQKGVNNVMESTQDV